MRFRYPTKILHLLNEYMYFSAHFRGTLIILSENRTTHGEIDEEVSNILNLFYILEQQHCALVVTDLAYQAESIWCFCL